MDYITVFLNCPGSCFMFFQLVKLSDAKWRAMFSGAKLFTGMTHCPGMVKGKPLKCCKAGVLSFLSVQMNTEILNIILFLQFQLYFKC